MSALAVGLFIVGSFLVTGSWLVLTDGRAGTSRQRQLVFVSGFLLLLLLPVLPALPKWVVWETTPGDAMLAPLGANAGGGGLSHGWLTGLFVLWSVGLAVVLAAWIRDLIRLGALLANVLPAPAAFAARCQSCLGERRVRLAILDGAAAELAPCVTGLVRPVLLLPRGAMEWSRAELSAVLHHEWKHVDRRDLVVRVIADFACAVHWFNPLSRRLRDRYLAEAEVDCDGAAVRQSGILRGEYAETLLQLATGRSAKAGGASMAVPPALALPMASGLQRGGSLENRIRMIMQGNEPVPKRMWPLAIVIGVVLLVLAVGNVIEVRPEVEAAERADVLAEEAEIRLAADPFPGE